MNPLAVLGGIGKGAMGAGKMLGGAVKGMGNAFQTEGMQDPMNQLMMMQLIQNNANENPNAAMSNLIPLLANGAFNKKKAPPTISGTTGQSSDVANAIGGASPMQNPGDLERSVTDQLMRHGLIGADGGAASLGGAMGGIGKGMMGGLGGKVDGNMLMQLLQSNPDALSSLGSLGSLGL